MMPSSPKTATSPRARTLAPFQIFLGGASYGIMATTYKLAYAAGFTWHQVVAAQAWFGTALFVLSFLVCRLRGRRWSALDPARIAKLMALGALTCTTSILYCSAMAVLPVSVALTLLFQFTWIGLVIQVVTTHRLPTFLEIASVLVIVVGTVFASGIYRTGLAGYDPVGLACGALAALTCALFVTFSGKVPAPCSTEQRGMVVCLGAGLTSLVACPDFFPSGVLFQGIAPFGLLMGGFGLFVPVLLFGLGTPHVPAGMSTVLASVELPAGLLVSRMVLAEPIAFVQWAGVIAILAGVGLSQLPSLVPARKPAHLAARSRKP